MKKLKSREAFGGEVDERKEERLWTGRALGAVVLVVGILIIFTILLLRIALPDRSGLLPEIGGTMPQIWSGHEGALTILFVSERCNTCLRRRDAYARALSDSNTFVVVEAQNPAAREGLSLAEELQQVAPTRVGAVREGGLRSLGVRWVPAVVEVDSTGRISSAGSSKLGVVSDLLSWTLLRERLGLR